jgi:hypothetical protein
MPKEKSPSTSKSSLKDKRTTQLENLKEVIKEMSNELEKLRGERKKQLDLLKSETQGLYEELDKLSKKAPSEEVTHLALENINYLIDETKKFLEDDAIIQRIKPFVAAGDNPQLRDAVLVLRQVMQGLQRYDASVLPRTNAVKELLSEARALREVLQIYLEKNHVIESKGTDSFLSDSAKRALNKDWFSGTFEAFRYEKLDEIDIKKYFSDRDKA